MARENRKRGLDVKRRATFRRLHVDTPKRMEFGLVAALRRMIMGRGVEFDGYREYVAGVDCAKDIDWKATMRSDKVLVKVLKKEEGLRVLFMVDGGSTMVFASKEKLKVEYAAEVVASLAYGIILADENVGLMIFSDKIKFYSAPRSGREQYSKVMNALINADNYGGKTDIISAMKYATMQLPKNSMIILLSDFLEMPESWETVLGMATTKLDVLGLMIRDPRDIEMPKGRVGPIVIEDPQTEEKLLFQPEEISGEYAQIAQQQAAEAKKIFTKREGGMVDLRTDEDFVNPLIKFFMARMSKWK